MPHLTIYTAGDPLELTVPAGTLLSEILRSNIPSFALPCSSNHTCGKCRVLAEGALSEPDDAELSLLTKDDLGRGLRLACSCRVLGEATVSLAADGASRILSWYQTPDFPRTESGCGLAVDIGTTTVAMQLIDRASGQILAEQLMENAQRGFGADVISRIEACREQGVNTLSSRIADQLERMARACMAQAAVDSIDDAVVTGNSTMLHLYEGLDPASLAVSPFDVQSYFGGVSRRTLAGAPVYLPRCIGAYVGADIVCAILSADLLKPGSTQLLTDIGTNGEMALYHDGCLTCCSTAAGPAFEGAGLSCGMPAAPGAIREVTVDDCGHVLYETVQHTAPVGVCGSGILDAAAVMLRTGAMDDTGALEEEDRYAIGDSSIFISQRDVRQIQLAKSAICAGLVTLLAEAGLSDEKVDRFTIAGGFGSSINRSSACEIGLFPAELKDKTVFIGNGALGGAAMLLQNKALRRQSEEFAAAATELSLSASPEFMDHYIDCMSFMAF